MAEGSLRRRRNLFRKRRRDEEARRLVRHRFEVFHANEVALWETVHQMLCHVVGDRTSEGGSRNMGWVWRDDAADRFGDEEFGVGNPKSPNNLDDASSDERCSTRRVVRSQCKTEEVEPGKFVRKCEENEEILRDCLGKPVEVLKSNKEYTEDDVTNQVVPGNHSFGSFGEGPLDFPELRSDMGAIERSLVGGIDQPFNAAEEMKNSLFGIFDPPPSYDRESSSPSMRRGIPIEGHPQSQREAYPKPSEHDAKYADLSGVIGDV